MRRIVYSAGLLLLGINWFSCNDRADKKITEGEELARRHCSTCHSFPDPSLLDQKTWANNVLPAMGERMNVAMYYQPYSTTDAPGESVARNINPGELFPDQDWEKITRWYLQKAPVKLDREAAVGDIKKQDSLFIEHRVKQAVFPVTTFVGFDTFSKKMIFADAVEKKLYEVKKDFTSEEIATVGTGVTDVEFLENEWLITVMGVLKPSDEKAGKLVLLSKTGKQSLYADSLNRPVHTSVMKRENNHSFVVSEFGFREGGLSMIFSEPGNKKERTVIQSAAGASLSRLTDLNGDGQTDMAALFAQADEQIRFFYNEGNNRFRQETVLRFPPVYGTNYFDIKDLNKDGHPDIVTTHGDNGDNSVVLKPYHGIRFFINDGNNHFTEQQFFPVYGAQKCVLADFDQDGDEDMVSIAYFADFENRAEEAFIFWRNRGEGAYDKFTVPGVSAGRWMTMEVADVEGDGDLDILLGNVLLSVGEVPLTLKNSWKNHPVSVMVLENILVKPFK